MSVPIDPTLSSQTSRDCLGTSISWEKKKVIGVLAVLSTSILFSVKSVIFFYEIQVKLNQILLFFW